jgi:pimeloyl-ACP methyl ester carboxylesterase
VNPVLYRYEEARACWSQVTAPVLWVDASESETLKRVGLTPEQYAERRAAFRKLRYVTVQGAGHMLHHDQPAEVARLIEEFLLA